MELTAGGTQAALILSSLMITLLSGFGGTPGGLHSPPYQPENGAFSIWGLIYTCIVVTAMTAWRNPQPWWFVASLCASLVSCGAWLIAVRRNVALSAVFIVCASVAATFSVWLLASRDSTWREGADWSLALGPGLLAGWLGLAAGLGVNLAAHARAGDDLPAAVLLPGAALACVAAVRARVPITGAVLLWAVFWARRDAAPTVTALTAALGLATILAAGVRLARFEP